VHVQVQVLVFREPNQWRAFFHQSEILNGHFPARRCRPRIGWPETVTNHSLQRGKDEHSPKHNMQVNGKSVETRKRPPLQIKR
jgi:hypothetical protein